MGWSFWLSEKNSCKFNDDRSSIEEKYGRVSDIKRSGGS